MCLSPIRIHNRNLFSKDKTPEPFDTIHVDQFGPLYHNHRVNENEVIVRKNNTRALRQICGHDGAMEICLWKSIAGHVSYTKYCLMIDICD